MGHFLPGEGSKPFFICVRLGRHHGVAFIRELNAAGVSLFALPVEFLHPPGRRRSRNGYDGVLRFKPLAEQGGIQRIFFRFLNVLCEDAPHDGFRQGRTGDKQVGDGRRPEIDCPGMLFRPGPCDHVKGEIGHEFFQQAVVEFFVAQAVLHEVKVVIRKQWRKF